MRPGCLGTIIGVAMLLLSLVGVTAIVTSASAQPAPATAPSTQPIDYESYDRDQAFKSAREALGETGEMRDEVLTMRYPRKDLEITIDGMGVPTAAGFETIFHFYYCRCGKLKVVGQFVLAAYEVNDVLDALRKGNHLHIASVAPMALDENPRLMLIRFQGEGDGTSLGKALKDSFNFIGEARMQKATGK